MVVTGLVAGATLWSAETTSSQLGANLQRVLSESLDGKGGTDMRTIETIREFNTANFSVRVVAVEDNHFDFSNWDEELHAETQAKIDSGNLMLFGVIATVTHRATGAELGEDSLWGCVYESPAAFMDHRACGVQNREYAARGVEGRCGSYFTDMVSEAIDQARKSLKGLCAVKVRTVSL